MEKIFTAKTLDEAKALAAEEFGVDELDIDFQVIEQPAKKLFGGYKGDFRVRAIYDQPVVDAPVAKVKSTAETGTPIDQEKFKHIIEYVGKILTQLGVTGYTIDVKKVGENNVLDISGENLGIIIGRRGETLDALQYLAILANNRGGDDESGSASSRPRLVVDCNGYREKRSETLEALAIRTCNKVIKQGRRITLEPMNPYERRIIHSKVADIEGVFSNSIGDEPYRKVVISAEIAKKRNYSNDRNRGGDNGVARGIPRGVAEDRGNSSNRSGGMGAGRRDDDSVVAKPVPGAVSNAVQSKSYKKSEGFSTSFEREYKRTTSPAPEISQDTVDVEKNTSLYGKIEL